MNVIETAGLTKTYKRKAVVQDLDLVVPKGACTVLVGANGAGKSTTLQMMMNLVAPTKGGASVLGKDCRRLEGADFRAIGYASENQILPSMLDSTGFFNYIRDLYPNWDMALEADARQRLKIPDRRSLRRLSRGERMKACVAAALPFRPELLVMDEPLSGLDPLSREELVRLLIEQAEETTMLISTHDLAEIERLATRVAIMHEGRLVLQGDIENVLRQFQDVAVRVRGEDKPSTLPRNWLNPRWDGNLLNFTHYAEDGADLIGQFASVFGPEPKPTTAPMNLAAITSAVMRAQARG